MANPLLIILIFSVHLPYRKMGEKALIYLLRHEWRHLPRWKNVINEIGIQEPVKRCPGDD